MIYLKASLKYGLAAFFVSLIAFLTFHFLDFKPLLNLNTLVLDIIIIGVFTFLASKEFRDYVNNKSLRFWQGMTIGFFVYMIMALCFSISVFVLMEFILPDILIEYKAQAALFLEESEVKSEGLITAEEFEKRLQTLENTTSWDLTISAFFKKVVVGMLLTPVSSIFLRR
ncbi:MAG: DUF4199 domain-containing protein [Bacteroidota bacterium]